MAVAESPVYQEVFYFLASSPTPDEILAFHTSEAVQQRIHDLLQASREGRLSPDEAAELDEFEQVEHFVRMLKLHTRKLLSDQ